MTITLNGTTGITTPTDTATTSSPQSKNFPPRTTRLRQPTLHLKHALLL